MRKTHKLIRLLERGLLHMKSICNDPRKCTIVKNNLTAT